MRNAAGQLADGLEFLRLAQLPLERAQFGYIFGDHLERVGIFVGA